jgi:hypothetical protein
MGREAREHGWLRCGHCGSRIPVPGVCDFAIEGPGGEVWRVVRPGSSEIETASGLVFDFLTVLLAVAAADVLGCAAIELVRALGEPSLADMLTSALPPWILGVAAVGALGFLTRQRLTIRADELTLSWVTLGRVAHPDCGLLSTWARVVNHDGQFVHVEKFPSRFYY